MIALARVGSDLHRRGEPGTGPDARAVFYEPHRARDGRRRRAALAGRRRPVHADVHARGRAAARRSSARSRTRRCQPDACEWPEAYFDEHIWFDDWPANLRVKIMALDPSKGRDARRGDFLGVRACWASTGRGCSTSRPTWPGGRRPRSWPTAWSCAAVSARRVRRRDQPVSGPAGRRVRGGVSPAGDRRRAAVEHRQPRQQAGAHPPAGPVPVGRRIALQERSPGTRLLVEQLQEFPVADHDDGPDALEMAIRLAGELFAERPPTTAWATGCRWPMA